jgi:hypothetical protein
MDIKHYNQPQKRDATFIKPPNILKAKVGSGGLDEKTLDRAQKVLENNEENFVPLAEAYLENMMKGITQAQQENATGNADAEDLISDILYPCMQLKANGGMFNYPLVTRIADRFVQFIEVVETIDSDVLDIALAFHKTIKIAVHGKASGDAGKYGDALVEELNDVCMRYFEKYKTDLSKKN